MLFFSLGNCSFRLHFSCFALLAFSCLFGGASGSAAVFLAAFFHECGHLAVLFLLHSPPESVTITALGCRIISSPDHSLRVWDEVLLSLMGPITNLVICFLMQAFGMGETLFAAGNLALGFVHLLPIEPLDGGLVLRKLLEACVDEVCAARIVRWISFLFLFPMGTLGFFVLLRTRYNFSLLGLCVYLMLYLALSKDYLPE